MAKKRRGFLIGAYELKTPQDNIRHYDGWAETYDDYMAEYRYVAPEKAAAMLAARIPAGGV
ncbi:MAG: methyltransferase, partial [Betaproteobacteria bacterium]|nr:methyltransferase [Betaproteobacteria bacterium]